MKKFTGIFMALAFVMLAGFIAYSQNNISSAVNKLSGNADRCRRQSHDRNKETHIQHL